VVRAGPEARAGGEGRQPIQGQVDLQAGAPEVEVLELAGRALGQGLPAHQAQEREPRVGAGHDGPGRHLAAVGEEQAPGPAALDPDALHGRLGLDHRPGLPGRRRQGLGEATHAALHVGPDPALASRLSHHVVEQDVAGARRARPRPGADQGVGGEGAPQRLALEPGLEDGSGGAEQDLEGPGKLLAQSQGTPARAQQGAEVPPAQPARLRGLGVEQRLDHPGHPAQEGLVVEEPCGVPLGEAGHLSQTERPVGAQQQAASVGKRREGGGVAGQQAQAVAAQGELAHQRGTQQARQVGGPGDPVARPELLGDAGAADHGALLEDPGAVARPGQVGGGGQGVVPGAHHRHVDALGSFRRHAPHPSGRARAARNGEAVPAFRPPGCGRGRGGGAPRQHRQGWPGIARERQGWPGIARDCRDGRGRPKQRRLSSGAPPDPSREPV